MKRSLLCLLSLTFVCGLVFTRGNALAQAPASPPPADVGAGRPALQAAEEDYAKLLKELDDVNKSVLTQAETTKKAHETATASTAPADQTIADNADKNLATLVKSQTELTTKLVTAAAKVATLRAGKGVAVDSDAIYKASLGALTTILVVAVLLETAMALLFNWVGFLAYFSRRAVRPLVMLIVSCVVVHVFDLDIMASLISIYKGSPVTDTGASGIPSKLLTAMILAGGSAGVRNMMASLGFRLDQTSDLPPPVGPKEAWLSIRVANLPKNPRKIQVHIRASPDAPPANLQPIAGTLGAESPTFKQLMMRNNDRFPANGGYVLIAEVLYEISVTADGVATPLLPPTQYVFARRAIVDIEVPYKDA